MKSCRENSLKSFVPVLKIVLLLCPKTKLVVNSKMIMITVFIILHLIESRKGFHPHFLTEPCLRLSPHTALLVYKSQGNKTSGMYQLPMWKQSRIHFILFVQPFYGCFFIQTLFPPYPF